MIWHVYSSLLLLFSMLVVSKCKYAYVVSKGGAVKVSVTDYFADIPDTFIARATYSNDINTTGWAYLELHTSDMYNDKDQAYAAGYLEGYLTRDLVWMHWQNMLKGYCYNKTSICGLIEDFVSKNQRYLTQMIMLHPLDTYWYQVRLYYIQIEGLAMGYNAATTDPYEWLSDRDIVWINMLGDLDEIALSLATPITTRENDLFDEHCTGLVKLLPDWSNLYTAHTTWNSYQSMLRIQKMYVMPLRINPKTNKIIPGYKMSMSSYPAFIQSTDDFYIISSGLVVSETTIGNSNRTLFEKVSPEGQIMEYARAMLANRLANNGYEWTKIFRRHNSGTYNNQWFIVDYNKFKPSTPRSGGEIRAGLLYVLEQLPGYIESADLTERLINKTYFPSYNIPYFPRVFQLSGGLIRISTYGDWFGYETNPRAKILYQKQLKINNLRDMYNTMRYNDYKHDPLSRCEDCRPPYSACNAVAARNDLNPANGTFPFRALSHRSHGATDAKVTSAYLRTSYRFLAVACPPHNISRGIPPFRYGAYVSRRAFVSIGIICSAARDVVVECGAASCGEYSFIELLTSRLLERRYLVSIKDGVISIWVRKYPTWGIPTSGYSHLFSTTGSGSRLRLVTFE